ncbi:MULTISPECIES: response regulator transcription factor [Salinimicrobium]|uniref:Phosphate regulon transcriptional regulatory protein PhoB n=1 Tax=Salinimicrobium profundisediminis TaxID=2994553 RepID=A0A9X3CV37_9FLAO|nr:response regulator transcription factor [Salinimicrobium profundisediminis]MCX2837145.1 response regulator transcription factor [Salinimicrobium profundisediminis]
MKTNDICILLVDDEPDIIEIIRYNLAAEGYRVVTAENGKQALKVAKENHPHLIILDVMMPEMDGIETCIQMRKEPELTNSMITFLTARGEDYSQMAGFDAGADDYITKPIKPKVLISKVKALLRRFNGGEAGGKAEIITAGNLEINREEYKVVKGGEEVMLPRKEFELLFLLASQPGRVFQRDEILERVWGNEVVVGGRTIDVHIRKLREKLGGESIQTIKGVGYKFVE